MWKEVFLVGSIVAVCFGASLDLCPEGSSCHSANEKVETSSFEFLNKYTQKDNRAIGSLIIRNASVNKVDPKLKYLKNLAYLDLSYNNVQISSIPPLNSLRVLLLKANNLKNINISLLPQNIEYLDLSENLLNQIPRDWRLLKNLKTLDLYKNPIDCDCNNVLNYERLIKSGIILPKPLTCHSPMKYAGKDISAVNCSIDDIMLYDEPYEGSGATDVFDDHIEKNAKLLNEEEDDDDESVNKNTIIDDKADNFLFSNDPASTTITEEEGSGDEGSGYGVIMPDSGILGCLENCSTPPPLPEDNSASPLPSFIDQLNIVIDDLNFFKDREPTSSTLSTTSSTTTEKITTNAPLPVKEPKVLTQNNVPLNSPKSEVDAFRNDTRVGELESASAAPKNSTAVYAVIGVGIFIAILCIIAFIKKRKSKGKLRNRREIPNPVGEEMKPLSKQPIQTINEKPVKNSNLPEQIPLINGQNGKPRDDTPKLKSFTPLAHPELTRDEEEEVPLQNGSSIPEDQDQVDLRPKLQPELLTPQRERVTIREAEIPDSIPRTPLLVHRKKNSEGEIVTTPVS